MGNTCSTLLFGLYAVFILGFSGCGEGDNDWVGTWSVQTVDGMDPKQQFTEIISNDVGLRAEEIEVRFDRLTMDYIFDEQGTLELEIDVSGEIDIKARVSRASFYMTSSGSGSYVLDGSHFTMMVTQNTTNKSYSVDQTETSAQTFTSDGTLTGTWIRKSNSLTLMGEDDSVAILKRR